MKMGEVFFVIMEIYYIVLYCTSVTFTSLSITAKSITETHQCSKNDKSNQNTRKGHHVLLFFFSLLC